jgi:hypothetical protein
VQQQHFGVGEKAAQGCRVQRQPTVGLWRDDDDVLAARVDDDDRVAAAAGDSDQTIGTHTVGVEVLAQLHCRGVVTDGADKLYVRTRTRRCHRLVCPLAAGRRAHRRR